MTRCDNYTPTDGQRAFVERYVPFLQDMVNDPEKQQWCSGFMADNTMLMAGGRGCAPAAVDKWGLEKTIYNDLMGDAIEMGMVPEDYLEVVDGLRGADGNGNEKPFDGLTDYELVCLVGHVVRAERFVENALLFAVKDGTLLRFLRELERRWGTRSPSDVAGDGRDGSCDSRSGRVRGTK